MALFLMSLQGGPLWSTTASEIEGRDRPLLASSCPPDEPPSFVCGSSPRPAIFVHLHAVSSAIGSNFFLEIGPRLWRFPGGIAGRKVFSSLLPWEEEPIAKMAVTGLLAQKRDPDRDC